MPPVNDNLVDAQVITGQSPSASGTTVSSTYETAESGLGFVYGIGDVWFLWQAPVSGYVTFTLTAPLMDGEFDVFQGFASQNTYTYMQNTFVTYNRLSGGSAQSINIPVVAGAFYLIQVTYYTVSGTFNISVSYDSIISPVTNDNFTQAQSIVYSSFPIQANDTFAMLNEIGVPSAQYNSLWYSFTSPTDGIITLNTNGATCIIAYTGDTLTDLSVIANGNYTGITIPIYANLKYYIKTYQTFPVLGYDDPFTLTASFVEITYPSNDNFSNSIRLTGNSFNESSDNSLATTQLYEDPTNYFSVWYSFRPSTNIYFTLAQTAGIPLNFKIYNGTDMENAVELTSGNNSVGIVMNADVTYYISVSSQSSTSYGAFSFSGGTSIQFPLNYIGPQNSPALASGSNGLNSIIVDSSNKIFMLTTPGGPVVYTSIDGGTTWIVDRTFPPLGGLLNYTLFQSIFFDENRNVVVVFVINEGNNVYHFQASVRDKNSAVWTDYISGSLTMSYAGGGGWSSTASFCQGDDGTIHFVQTYFRNVVSGFIAGSQNNIMYCNFKDGVFSSLTPITQYNTNEGAGFTSLGLVNHGGQIIIFWRVYSVIYQWYDGPLKYAIINPSSPLIMDAIEAAKAWGTGLTYYVGDLVLESGLIYECLIQHTAVIFATDLGNGDWGLLSSYTTPTIVPSLVNQDVFNVKSDGINLYFNTYNGGFTQGLTGPIYKNFIDITPYTHPFLVAGAVLYFFEIAMNGDMIVYGEFVSGPGIAIMRINNVWLEGWQGNGILDNKNLDFAGGHTYNFASLV